MYSFIYLGHIIITYPHLHRWMLTSWPLSGEILFPPNVIKSKLAFRSDVWNCTDNPHRPSHCEARNELEARLAWPSLVDPQLEPSTGCLPPRGLTCVPVN